MFHRAPDPLQKLNRRVIIKKIPLPQIAWTCLHRRTTGALD